MFIPSNDALQRELNILRIDPIFVIGNDQLLAELFKTQFGVVDTLNSSVVGTLDGQNATFTVNGVNVTLKDAIQAIKNNQNALAIANGVETLLLREYICTDGTIIFVIDRMFGSENIPLPFGAQPLAPAKDINEVLDPSFGEVGRPASRAEPPIEQASSPPAPAVVEAPMPAVVEAPMPAVVEAPMPAGQPSAAAGTPSQLLNFIMSPFLILVLFSLL